MIFRGLFSKTFLNGLVACLILGFVISCGSSSSSQKRARVDTGYNAATSSPTAKWKPTKRDSIPVVMNDRVKSWVRKFNGPLRKYFVRWVKRLGHYGPTIENVLQEEGVPIDLIYLSMIESGFNLSAYSTASATGPWQFIASTGRMYNLKSSPTYDQRRDIVAATRAAARHLKDLHKMYGDWYLAFSAYNAGPGKVNRAIKRTGSRNYWTISSRRSRHLMQETKDYVPKILAALHIVKHYKKYGYTENSFGHPMEYERIVVKGSTSVKSLAKSSRITEEQFRKMNPAILGNSLPDGNVAIYIPKGTKRGIKRKYSESTNLFASNYNRKKKSRFKRKRKNKTKVFASASSQRGYTSSGVAHIIHKDKVNPTEFDDQSVDVPNMVAKNTSLQFIDSDTPGVIKTSDNSSSLLANNYNPKHEKRNFRNNPSKFKNRGMSEEDVPNSQVFDKKVIASILTENEVENTISNESNQDSENVIAQNTNVQTRVRVKKIRHQIKRGESIGLIASKYNVSVSDLKKWNGLRSNKILANQRLIIKKEVNEDLKQNVLVASQPSQKTQTKNFAYRVKKGDTIGLIASRNGVRLSDLKKWNGLRSNKIVIGQKIIVKKQISQNSDVEYASLQKTQNTSSTTKSVHKVDSGETLSEIATQYGVDVSDIKDWNDLDSNKILVNQKLVVKSQKVVAQTPKKSVHKIAPGETLSEIASQYGVDVSDIKEWNDLDSNKILANQKLIVKANSKAVSKRRTQKRRVYKVKPNDNLIEIAKRYNVDINDIKSANKLNSNTIYVGQRLKIVASEADTSKLASQTQKIEKQYKRTNYTRKVVYHKIRRGDTLWSVANKYKVTISDIKKWNRLRSSKVLHNQKLKIVAFYNSRTRQYAFNK